MAAATKCPAPMKATSNGLFQGDDPLNFALPVAILQICLVVVLTRVLAFFLRPLRQPRVIAEIIGGILLGPSALGRSTTYLHRVFPARSITVLDTLANLGLLFFMFLVGLELDLSAIRKTGKKTLSIAFAGITLPFALGIGSSFILSGTVSKGVSEAPFLVFMGVALSITAFPVLARILAELKLLTTDVGRLAMSAAAVNDVAAWILLALAIALSGNGHSPLVSLWVFLCGSAFVVISAVVVPRLFKWMEQRCPPGEPLDEIYVCATLVCILAAGFITDAIGIHALFGAFVVGILVPKDGALAGALVDKIEDLVSGLFLPLYFVSSGLKTNIATIQGPQSWGLLALVIFTACFGKIVGTMVVSLMCRVPFREAVALGFLMNTKGLVELIVLNIGKDRGVLNDQTFAIMVLMALFTTFITTPIVMAVYKPAKDVGRGGKYKHRTVQSRDPNTEMRMLACFYSTTRSVPALINLIEASRGSTEEKKKAVGLRVYAMHLMELTERSSVIRLMVRKASRNNFWNNNSNSTTSQVVVAFDAFRHLSNVVIKPTVAVASMNTMHEDICATAGKRRAAVIILPFHKQQRLDGQLEVTRNDLRQVNRRVLEHAPCSVAIFIDRGFGGLTHVSARNVDYVVTVLFFGGPDDREAVSYGARMAQHPGIKATVVRFLAGPNVTEDEDSVVIDIDHTDDRFLDEFKRKVSIDDSIEYKERELSEGGEQVVQVIREHSRCNMFLVGRVPEGHLAGSIGTRGDCPELGPVGGLLTSQEFSGPSVLVFQQYRSQLSAQAIASLKDEDGDSE